MGALLLCRPINQVVVAQDTRNGIVTAGALCTAQYPGNIGCAACTTFLASASLGEHGMLLHGIPGG